MKKSKKILIVNLIAIFATAILTSCNQSIEEDKKDDIG